VKTLVTGGAGFIGSHLADRLIEDGHEVVVLDDLSTGRREQVPSTANFYQMDVETRWLPRVIEREKPEAVFHLAAQLSVPRSVEDPVFDAHVNVMGSLSLIQACRRAKVRRFVFFSTGGAIYGQADVIPTAETQAPAPMAPYGAAKLAVEHYLRLFQALEGFPAVTIRPGNVYGPRQDPHGEAGVVAIFARALLQGEVPVINGDGAFTRDYVYVGDVVEAAVAALRSDATGSFNVGTGIETDVNRLYELIRRATGKDVEARRGPARPGDARRSCLDAHLASEVLGWRPRVSLEEGIRLTVEHFAVRV